MTTICFRDGIVAADSRTSSGGWTNPAPEQKLLKEGAAIFALCGDWADCAALKHWIDHPDGPQPNGDCTVIVFKGGEVTLFSAGGSFIEGAPFRAWGSGTPVALGALHAGCSAEEAVRIACLVDPYSGGPVSSMKVPSNG